MERRRKKLQKILDVTNVSTNNLYLRMFAIKSFVIKLEPLATDLRTNTVKYNHGT